MQEVFFSRVFIRLGALDTLAGIQQHKAHNMATNIHTFTVGSRQFQMFTLQPFAATQHAMKLKKIMEKGFVNGLDSNIISIISQVDEKTLNDVIFPILAASALTCTSEEKKLQSSKEMDEIYSIEDMDEFFIAVWEVLKVNFGPFFRKMAKNLFGFDLSTVDLEKVRATLLAAVEKGKSQQPPQKSDQTRGA